MTEQELPKSLLPDADLFLIKQYLPKEKADTLFTLLDDSSRFERHNLYFMNGEKLHVTKSWRQSYWFGKYPQATQDCESKLPTDYVKNYPFPDEVSSIKLDIESQFGMIFNSCLVGRFDDPKDKIGFHTDQSTGMGKNPYVASLSLGRSRKFKIKRIDSGEKLTIILEHGDLIVMGDQSNVKYKHAVPADSECSSDDPRLNLTFRNYKYHPKEKEILF